MSADRDQTDLFTGMEPPERPAPATSAHRQGEVPVQPATAIPPQVFTPDIVPRIPYPESRRVDLEWKEPDTHPHRVHGTGSFRHVYVVAAGEQISHDSPKLEHVGIADTGQLVNPHGYPEDLVREHVLRAIERGVVKRKRSAAKGAATRKRRHDLKVDRIAREIVAGKVYGPSHQCASCDKPLTDAISIKRGIGTDCWEALMQHIEKLQAEKLAKDSTNPPPMGTTTED
jgi:hypothetical protein